MQKKERVYWVDTAKALGIFLVYYGHVVEKLFRVSNEVAFTQLKFIYAFHMPFFFFVSGFFFKKQGLSFGTSFKDLFLKRIVPVLFFGVLLLPVWPLYLYGKYGYIQKTIITGHLAAYLQGQPNLNSITWFLICLFIAEVIAILVLQKINKVLVGVFIAAVFLRFGLMLTSNLKEAEISLGVLRDTWYIYEGIVAFGFYALGYSTFKHLKRLLSLHAIKRFLLLAFFLSITILTFNLNTPYEDFVVEMKVSFHGDSNLFLITSLAGTLSLLLLSTFIPKSKAINFIGRNTLILIGTNGFFHTFINAHLAARFNHLDSEIWVTIYILLVSIFSIMLSIPVILLFNKYLPQLVGKPYQDGPWMPDLSTLKSAWLKEKIRAISLSLGTTHE